VRQGEEGDVVSGQDGGRRVLEPSVSQRGQVRVDRPEELTRVATRRHGADLDVRVGEQEPEDLSSGVPARPRDCCPDHNA
jgi:hypothetical protein